MGKKSNKKKGKKSKETCEYKDDKSFWDALITSCAFCLGFWCVILFIITGKPYKSPDVYTITGFQVEEDKVLATFVDDNGYNSHLFFGFSCVTRSYKENSYITTNTHKDGLKPRNGSKLYLNEEDYEEYLSGRFTAKSNQ